MSTLQQSLAAHRAEESTATRLGLSAQTPLPAITIHATDGRRWVLPWSHFVSAEHRIAEDGEHLILAFSNHEVALKGLRLALVMEGVAGLRVEFLSEVPARYRGQISESEAWVESVSVRPLASLPGSPGP